MKDKTEAILNELLERLPPLSICKEPILSAFTLMAESFSTGGKLMICGNGGSAADSDHIAGELLKGFLLKRPLPPEDKAKLAAMLPEDGEILAESLQQALPALSLTGHPALISAIANDTSAVMVYAQQVYALGKPGDVLLGISTSGQAANVANAVKVARAAGLRTIGLTGGDGGLLACLADVAVVVPARETYRIQEYHLPIYHTLCAMLEQEFFGS